MNDTGIIVATAIFVIVLFFCTWVSFSAQIITSREILTRVGIVVAVFAGIFAATAGHHRNVH
jgi:hypothetical protein